MSVRLRYRKVKIFASVCILCALIIGFNCGQQPFWNFFSDTCNALILNTKKFTVETIVRDVKGQERLPEQGQVVARRFPYLNDPVCRNLSLSVYEDGTFNITALVSYPGSGNTWTRHLLQLATGVFTGSFYFDIDLLAGGFLGEKETWYSGSTIAQKFHEKYSPRLNIDKAILLIREPIPAIKSFANYLEAGHTGTSYRLPYNHREWPSFLLQSAYNWLSLPKSWLESKSDILVVYYEHLRLRPVENLKRICNFIHHNCPNLNSVCFQRKLEGSFRRSDGRVKLDHGRSLKLPTEVQDIVSRGIDYLNTLLLKAGHEPMPINMYEYYSAPLSKGEKLTDKNHYMQTWPKRE